VKPHGKQGGIDSASSTSSGDDAASAPWRDAGERLGGATSRWLDWPARNARIHFVAAGSSGPPLLLVHGFGVGGYHFERNLPALARRHRVWAVDLLGQGAPSLLARLQVHGAAARRQHCL
jgi:pimeloyl-ACP methyl ester carboxylesterase